MFYGGADAVLRTAPFLYFFAALMPGGHFLWFTADAAGAPSFYLRYYLRGSLCYLA